MLYLGNKIVQYNEKFSTKDNFDIQSLDDKNLSLFSPIDSFHISELNNFQNDENKFYKTNTHNTDERNNIKMRIVSNSNDLRKDQDNKYAFINNILYSNKDIIDTSKEMIKIKEDNEAKKGRRKKYELYEDEAKHNKFREDNIMRKIKGFILRYILDLLNKSLIGKHYKFYPLNAEFNENLRKDLNEDLLKRKISDIFENTELNKKNIKFENPNKKLIHKILEEKIETKTIFILNLSFNDILDFIRENDSEKFLEKIREKEQKNNEDDDEYVEEYMEEVSRLLNGYEKWFEKKFSRNIRKRHIKEKQKYMF